MKFESIEENLLGSEQKINEYVQRIKNGESLDSFQLPPNMRGAVERRLEEYEEDESQGINETTPKLNDGEPLTNPESLEDIRNAIDILNEIIEKTRQYDEARNKITEEITKQFQKGLTPITNQMYTAMLEKINKEVGYFTQYELGFTISDLNHQTENIVENLNRKYDLSEFLKKNPNINYTSAESLISYITSNPLDLKKPEQKMTYPDIDIEI